MCMTFSVKIDPPHNLILIRVTPSLSAFFLASSSSSSFYTSSLFMYLVKRDNMYYYKKDDIFCDNVYWQTALITKMTSSSLITFSQSWWPTIFLLYCRICAYKVGCELCSHYLRPKLLIYLFIWLFCITNNLSQVLWSFRVDTLYKSINEWIWKISRENSNFFHRE